MKKHAKHVPETAVILAALFVVLFTLAGCEGPLDWTKNAARAVEQAASPQIVGIDINSAEEFEAIGVDPDFPADGNYDLRTSITLVDRDPVEFNGTFDGNGHTITLNSFASGALTGTNLGIFTAVNTVDETAWINNLTIEVNLDTQNPLVTSAEAIGMLAGSAANAEFDSITVSAGPLLSGPLGITDSNTAASVVEIDVGGIIGSITGSSISNSTSNLAINATVTMGGFITSTSLGGIAGTAVSGSTITNAVNTGAVSLTATSVNYPWVGGIAGHTYDNTTVTLCKNTGDITAIGTNMWPVPYVGGIVGRHTNASTISQSYANCNVTASSDAVTTQITAGGIAGAMRNEDNNQTYISYITDCYFNGNVTVRAGTNANPPMTGGIVGFIYTGGTGNTRSGIVANCYARGTVTTSSPQQAIAGGIAGYLWEQHATVTNSVALNDIVRITYSSAGRLIGVRRVAGLVNPGILTNNLAWANMRVIDNNTPVTPIPDPNGPDGANTVNNPPSQAEYVALNWDFGAIWNMGTDGYPVLRNRP